MRRWSTLAGIVLLGIAAIVVTQRRHEDVMVGPEAILHIVADSEQELTRMPVRFTRRSDQEEIQAGDQIAEHYAAPKEEKPSAETLDVERYLTQVGTAVAIHAHRKLPYKVHYLRDRNIVDAFALPGGHVYVGAGLLALMDSEDELASVLGHEIEHVDHYHCAERLQQAQALRKLPLGDWMAIPIQVFDAGYSKDQEFEADREGVRLAVAAGYSPNGAIRMFETFQRLYDEYQGRSRTPQQELSQVAQEILTGYFRSHPLPAERIQQIQTLISSEHWPLHAERDLAVAYIFTTDKAAAALAAHAYPQAQQLALQSLRAHAEQAHALNILAQAQFLQADFRGAAASYRKVIELDPSQTDMAEAYAKALAAADRATAATEFRRWLESLHSTESWGFQVPAAGLALLAGDSAPAQRVTAQAEASAGEEWSPHWLAELAWWYYLAGDNAAALELLNRAVQRRPGETRFLVARAWVQIQNRTLADALQSLDAAYDESSPNDAERHMARAVAYWQAHRSEDAMGEFEPVVLTSPEWRNPRWVQALYTPLVAESVQQMQAELDRRRKQARSQ